MLGLGPLAEGKGGMFQSQLTSTSSNSPADEVSESMIAWPVHAVSNSNPAIGLAWISTVCLAVSAHPDVLLMAVIVYKPGVGKSKTAEGAETLKESSTYHEKNPTETEDGKNVKLLPAQANVSGKVKNCAFGTG